MLTVALYCVDNGTPTLITVILILSGATAAMDVLPGCTGLNGAHSPHSSLHTHTPSPPTMAAGAHSSMAAGAQSPSQSQLQQLPPTCGARQLSKLKRFLTTLQQFGSDISGEIGERVRSLVLALVVSAFYLSPSG